MTEADVQQLLAAKKIRAVTPDPETARAEIDVARRHIASAEKIMGDDSTLAFTALYDAMRKAIAAHMRSRGYRVTRGPGAHAKTGDYAMAALDRLDIGSHLDEFDALRALRNQSEYEALHVDVEEVREALEHVRGIVEAIAGDL
ncbi:MAG TPA: HEPN domain-containing protein [Gaiellaceae bacterium]|nr:HEPN domain-containing protein [Gaiellaceae bacterium]